MGFFDGNIDGPLDSIFDFNRDGHLDPLEKGAEIGFIVNTMGEDETERDGIEANVIEDSKREGVL